MGEGTVLLRRSALGDVVLVGAVAAAVPGPVTVVTAPAWVEVASRLRGVDRVVPWPKHAMASDIAASIPPGRVVDLQGSRRSLALCRALGRPVSRIEKRSIKRRLRLWWGRGPVRPTVPQIYAEASDVEPVSAPWIDVADLQRDALALVPGASWATKRWSIQRMIDVGLGWDGPVVVLGGPGEEADCSLVAERLPDARVVCESGFEGTVRELARVSVCVSADTGLMHLAAACGARVVGLFGPTHPDDGFWVHRGEVVQRALGCRPCSLHGDDQCPKTHHRCMDIGADEVLAAVRRVAR